MIAQHLEPGLEQRSAARGFGDDAVARTNVGGTWQTSDYYSSADYHAVTVDPGSGTAYAGGHIAPDGWFVRSGPAAAPASSLFSTASIATTSHSDSRRPVDDLFAA